MKQLSPPPSLRRRNAQAECASPVHGVLPLPIGGAICRTGGRLFRLLMLAALGCGPVVGDELPLDWFDDPVEPAVPQVGAGELAFLTSAPGGRVLHSDNRLTIGAHSLEDGWVALEQCYRGLDPVPDAEIEYAYKAMRGLRLLSWTGIGVARAHASSVELQEISEAVQLCVAAEVRIFSRGDDGVYRLRNGPFHRRFLDGFFPMRVTLEVHFPADHLHLLSVSPAAQAGFRVERSSGRFDIDALFAGSLTIEARFAPASPLRPGD